MSKRPLILAGIILPVVSSRDRTISPPLMSFIFLYSISCDILLVDVGIAGLPCESDKLRLGGSILPISTSFLILDKLFLFVILDSSLSDSLTGKSVGLPEATTLGVVFWWFESFFTIGKRLSPVTHWPSMWSLVRGEVVPIPMLPVWTAKMFEDR